MSLSKRFQIAERMDFQFRAEGFNVFNTPLRSQPGTDPNNTGFGLVPLGQRNYPRQVQLGMKFNF
jgi:hypothetical protein